MKKLSPQELVSDSHQAERDGIIIDWKTTLSVVFQSAMEEMSRLEAEAEKLGTENGFLKSKISALENRT